MFEIKGKYSTAKVMIDDVEELCVSQITNFLNHPAFTNPIAIMPDTHAGKGSVIGFTMPITDKVIPNVIGVDIGCGMLTCMFSNMKKDQLILDQIDNHIREKVPFGFNIHEEPFDMKKFNWNKVNGKFYDFLQNAHKHNYKIKVPIPNYDYNHFIQRCKHINVDPDYIARSLGSLGGGK